MVFLRPTCCHHHNCQINECASSKQNPISDAPKVHKSRSTCAILLSSALSQSLTTATSKMVKLGLQEGLIFSFSCPVHLKPVVPSPGLVKSKPMNVPANPVLIDCDNFDWTTCFWTVTRLHDRYELDSRLLKMREKIITFIISNETEWIFFSFLIIITFLFNTLIFFKPRQFLGLWDPWTKKIKSRHALMKKRSVCGVSELSPAGGWCEQMWLRWGGVPWEWGYHRDECWILTLSWEEEEKKAIKDRLSWLCGKAGDARA